jgi:hypothetical protein
MHTKKEGYQVEKFTHYVFKLEYSCCTIKIDNVGVSKPLQLSLHQLS